MRLLPSLSLLLIPLATIKAQDHMDRGHGHTVIQDAEALVDQERHDEALAKLATIHRSDSLHERSLLMRARILISQRAHESAEKTCRDGMAMNGEMADLFMLMRTAVLLDLDSLDACVAACDSAIAVLPGNFRVRHVKAMAFAKKGDNKSALRQAMDNVRLFPYQRDGHILLGNMAQSEDRVAQAALAYMMAQLVAFDDHKAEQVLIQYDKCLGGTAEPAREGYDLSMSGDDLDELDLLIKSKIAMDKKYKVKPDLSYPTCRQSHLLFRSLEDRKQADPGFFESFYGPMAKAIMQQGRFEAFVYHCLAASNNPEVNASAVKNKTKVAEFRKWIGVVMYELFQTFPTEEGGPSLLHLYNNNSDLLGYGPNDPKTGHNIGEWIVFGRGGRVSGRGSFNDSGEREGRWTFWSRSGLMESEWDYRKGKFHGALMNYHGNGNLMDSTAMQEGKRHGPACSYHRAGGPNTCKTAVEGEWTGPVVERFPCGVVEWEYSENAGKMTGPVRQYHPTGQLRYTAEFADGVRTGMQVEYHINGQKAEEYTNVAGKAEGPFTAWHLNGQVSKQGTLKNGMLTNERRSYDEWGTLRMVERFNDSGKLNGVREEFGKDGSKTIELEYRNDLLVRYTYFAPDGSILGQGTRSKGKFQFKGFHPDGTVRVEGVYLDEGMKDGHWKYYYADGTLDKEEHFDKGKDVGTHTYYDEGGHIVRKDEYYERGENSYWTYTRYYRSGKVRDIGHVKGDKTEGVLRRFLPNGTPSSVEYYVNGERQGWQEYLDPDGKPYYAERTEGNAVAERVSYDASGTEYERILVPTGPYELVTHYPGGKVMQRCSLMNGVRHGRLLWLYPDGSIEIEGEYLNGERHGNWVYYHPNGKKRTESGYIHGLQDGIHRQYSMDGILTYEGMYDTGRLQGTHKRYYPNGKPSHERHYEHDVLHGRSISFTLDGTPNMVRFYHKGDLVAYGSPAADGTPRDSIPLGRGIARLETTFPNGKPARSMTYRNGRLDGDFIEYHTNGRVMDRRTYKAGDEDGVVTEYHENGQVMETTPYEDGLIHGERVIHWDNGQVRERMTYVHGRLHGPWTLYDRSGKRMATYLIRNDDVVEIGK